MGYLIAERFINENDLYTACVSLISHNREVRADACGSLTAVGHTAVSLERNAMTKLCARRIAGKADSVSGSGNRLDTEYRFVKIFNELVHARYDDHILCAPKKCRYTVGITVHVIKLTVLGDRVGAGKVEIRTESRSHCFILLLLRQIGKHAINVIVIAVFERINDTRFGKRNGAAVHTGDRKSVV